MATDTDAKKWVLACGRFSPNEGGGLSVRVQAMEAYVASLSEELEFCLSELGRAVEAVSERMSGEE